jgi:xanthine dehydrogenase molybdopterin-binding subunit B
MDCTLPQGLGFFTVENHQYNADGKLTTVGAGKYKVPTVSSIPLQMNVTLLKDSTNPSSEAIYSSKVRFSNVFGT